MTREQRFRELLGHAWTHSAVYRRLYAQHGLRERDLPHVPLEDLPVVSKAEVMVHFDEAVTDPRLRLDQVEPWMERDRNPLSLYLDEYVVIYSSAGSSIRSIVPCTPRTWQLMTTTAAPHLLPADAGARIPMRSAFYFGVTGHFASSTNASLASHAAHEVLWVSTFDPVEEVWARLNAFKPERLNSYSSTVARLAEWTLEGRLRIRPRSVLVTGDRLSPHTRSLIQEAWGAEVYELYAAVESLYMAVRPPGGGDFQVLTALNVLEVVDGSHRAVRPGERGRVLLTNLVSRTLPLIRFDLHDEAVLGRAGFGADTLASLDGKTDICLPVRLSDGRPATLPLHVLHRLQVPGCGNVQFVSHGLDEVEVRYEAHEDLDVPVETALRALLATAGATVRSLRVRRAARIDNDAVTFKYVDVVPPGRAACSLIRLGDLASPGQEAAGITPAAPEPAEESARPASVIARFEEIAARDPDRVAVTDGEERELTYRELRRAAHRVAQALLGRGFDPGRPVLVLLGPGVETVAAMLGVLRAGGFYLAVDPAMPAARKRAIVAETGPAYIVAGAGQEDAGRALAEGRRTVLPLAELLGTPAAEIAFPAPSAEMPAVLLYTSGSTGSPKGVVLGHGTVLNRVRRYTQDFGLGPEDRLTLLQSPAVSAGVRDLFGALLNGATLAIYDVRSRGVQPLPDWLTRNRISVFYAVPTLWRLFVDTLTGQAFPSIRAVRLGGEAVQARDLAGFKAHFPPGCRLVNGYAATETDTICQHVMDHATELVADRMPVGRPVRGISVAIVDEDGHAVAGAVGELVVDGDTVADGYWDPRQQRIVHTPAHRFAAGDLGYQLPDGRVFLVGRRDLIVKVHGHRIHLTEVEDAVAGVDGVREAAAVPRTTAAGDTAIAVYYVSAAGGDVPLDRLRRAAAAILPGPSASISFTSIPALPRLPGGKVNRNLLRDRPARDAPRTAEAIAYGDPIEAGLARMWSEILGIPTVPREVSFFALGGDSVTAFRVLGLIQDGLRVEISVADFFDHSTIAELAALIAGELATRHGAA